jgi:catechol 2,3-dioxygenase-like lactoylglutathione lyase family enzyme
MSTTQNAVQPTVFEGNTPILRVKSVTASIDYYVHKLGFNIKWQTPIFACVSRGRCTIFLSEGDQGHPGAWIWIGVSDADTLLEEYRRTGAKIRHLPTNYSWAYEMQVEDPDGNILRCGSEPKEKAPIGDWLDMNGVRWINISDQEWKRADPQ